MGSEAKRDPGDSNSTSHVYRTPGVYERLGLRGCINATGHVTRLGGSLMPPEVLDAMAEAAGAYVDIGELHRAVGKRLAQITGAQAALVTSGAAGSIVLGTAACIAGDDKERIQQLPDASGMKNEVLMPQTPGWPWVRYVRNAGGVIVECADANDLQAKVGDRSAMLMYLPSVHDDGPIPLEEVLAIGRSASIPVMVDAADKLPPPENLRRLIALGIDLVGFSGGKGLSGPQCTGLLMGRRELVEAAYLNSLSPGIGRPMKVGKEEIVGLLTAVEVYVRRDHAGEQARWEKQLSHIEERLRSVPGIETELYEDIQTAEGKRLAIRLSEGDRSCAEVRKALAKGNPRIMLGSGKDGALTINPQTMQPGEERLVADRFLEAVAD